ACFYLHFGQQIGDLLFGAYLDFGEQVKLGYFDTVRFCIARYCRSNCILWFLYTFSAKMLKIKNAFQLYPGCYFLQLSYFLGGSYLLVFIFQTLLIILKHMVVFAGIIILMLWLYITGFIIIIGAEINAIMHQKKSCCR
ncbi:hypothetical protein ESM33_13335, partial [Staphylococcus sp. SNAZ 36]